MSRGSPVRGPGPAPLRLHVNGAEREGTAPPRMSLLDFLREELDLTSVHAGCEHGVCGACTVLLDGVAVRACLMFAVMAEGHRLTTVEGLASPGPEGKLGVVQEAFWDAHALQCGYCTPGMILAAEALLAVNPDPDDAAIREALSANLCRCTGYVQIVEAVRLAADWLHQRRSSSP